MVTGLLFSSLMESLRLNSVNLVFVCIRNALGCRVDPEELGTHFCLGCPGDGHTRYVEDSRASES